MLVDTLQDLIVRTDRTILVIVTQIAYEAVADVGSEALVVLTAQLLCFATVLEAFFKMRWKDSWLGLAREMKSVVALVLAKAIVTTLLAQFPIDTNDGLIAATVLLTCASSVSTQYLDMPQYLWLRRVFASTRYIYSTEVAQNSAFRSISTTTLVSSSLAFATGAKVVSSRLGISYVLGAYSMVAVDATIDGLIGIDTTAGSLFAQGFLVLFLVLFFDSVSGGSSADDTVVGDLRGFAAYRAGQQLQVLVSSIAKPYDKVVQLEGIREDVMPMLLILILAIGFETVKLPKGAVFSDVALSATAFMVGDLLNTALSTMATSDRVVLTIGVLLIKYVILRILTGL